MFVSFFVLFFCCKGDAVMFGLDFRCCLSLGSGAKPLQVLYFSLFGVVVCGLSEGRVEGKLNFPGALTFSPCFFLLLTVNGSVVVCGVVCRHFL